MSEVGAGAGVLDAYLSDARARTLDEIHRIVPADHRFSGGLYELMLDYPLRTAKGLRPALCLATCRALGGHLEAVLPSAAVLELYHNAFLIHDDVEDGSEKRRNEETLHRLHGVPVAVNVGDGMLALTMQPLLENMERIGLGRALRVLDAVARMSRESAEGQMMELSWIRTGSWQVSDRDYIRMVHKKSAWYSFITPVLVGAISAGASERERFALTRFCTLLGVAFQIQDDVLNLAGDERDYGKEIEGDLWEGKHTLILIHALRCSTPAERTRAQQVLARARPPTSGASLELRKLLDALEADGELGRGGAARLRGWLDVQQTKTAADVRFLAELIGKYHSVAFAWKAACARARRAERTFRQLAKDWPQSVHRSFLEELTSYVVERER